MLTIRTSKVFSHALGEYLRQADYYSQGMKVAGRCFGQLCAQVGLVEGAVISDVAIERVASNRHALTEVQLTVRMKTNRRAGYDATFNAPKSVSIQAFLGGDERLIAAHERAVTEALAEVESLSRRQDGIDQHRAGRTAAAQALANAATVQRLLVDAGLQKTITHKLVVVDEYGLLALGQLNALVAVAEKHHARLLLVGDSAQHKSVEAGDGARILEKETRTTIAELREIRRQSANPAYRAAAQDLAAGRFAAGLKKLNAMGAIVEIEDPVARRAQMVECWHEATRKTKTVRTAAGDQSRAQTALMVAPTWNEIDALNVHARAKLRSAGQITGADQTFVALTAKDWTKAQQRDVRNYQPGDVLAAHQATKHFQKHDELRVVRKDKRRLIVARGTEEFSVSPRQSGMAWRVCEERPMAVATGDRIRLRAVSHVTYLDGPSRRLANGSMAMVQSVNADGRLVLADGATLHSRLAVHGYAMTSHAAQGLTVDHVFIAGAISREGLYVSATRGREGIRIFVPDRDEFLQSAGLRSETRMSALEFARLRDPMLPPGLPRWLHPLRLSLRYLGLVRVRLGGSPEPYDHHSSPRTPAHHHEQSIRVRL